MTVFGIRHLLCVVSLVLGVALLVPAPVAHAQPPGSSQGLLRLGDFDAACSKDTFGGPSDGMCRQGILISLGKQPIVEEVRRPDGGMTRETKTLAADPGKAGWLGEEACAHGRWQSCMLYAMLLERGDGVPQDRLRAEALTHFACSKGHASACTSLQSRGITPAADIVLPARPSWVSQPRAEQQRKTETQTNADALLRFAREWQEKQKPQSQELSPEQKLLLDQKQLEERRQQAAAQAAESAPPVDPAEADMITKCLAGTREVCHSLAQGYEQGTGGLPRDATRSSFYYEKACDLGHALACAHLGKAGPGEDAPSTRTPTTVLVVIAIGGLLGAAVFVSRRRTREDNTAGSSRPIPVRPPTRSPR